jgi:hypothetical protein
MIGSHKEKTKRRGFDCVFYFHTLSRAAPTLSYISLKLDEVYSIAFFIETRSVANGKLKKRP